MSRSEYVVCLIENEMEEVCGKKRIGGYERHTKPLTIGQRNCTTI